VTERQHAAVQSQYTDLLQAMEDFLSKTAYMFGKRPTLIDFAFCGQFFRHFFLTLLPEKSCSNELFMFMNGLLACGTVSNQIPLTSLMLAFQNMVNFQIHGRDFCICCHLT
jgi:hypothetical protein